MSKQMRFIRFQPANANVASQQASGALLAFCSKLGIILNYYFFIAYSLMNQLLKNGKKI